jgi:hypothetical protein
LTEGGAKLQEPVWAEDEGCRWRHAACKTARVHRTPDLPLLPGPNVGGRRGKLIAPLALIDSWSPRHGALPHAGIRRAFGPREGQRAAGSAPTARLIPAWGNVPGIRTRTTARAESPFHRRTATFPVIHMQRRAIATN